MTTDEINAFLIEKTKEQSIRYSNVNAKCLKEFGTKELYVSDITSSLCTDSMPLDMKLRNLVASANNNMVAGLYYEHEVINLRKRNKKEQKLKQAAFLFILRHGLMNEFQSFVNNYHGDVKEDIYREHASHA